MTDERDTARAGPATRALRAWQARAAERDRAERILDEEAVVERLAAAPELAAAWRELPVETRARLLSTIDDAVPVTQWSHDASAEANDDRTSRVGRSRLRHVFVGMAALAAVAAALLALWLPRTEPSGGPAVALDRSFTDRFEASLPSARMTGLSGSAPTTGPMECPNLAEVELRARARAPAFGAEFMGFAKDRPEFELAIGDRRFMIALIVDADADPEACSGEIEIRSTGGEAPEFEPIRDLVVELLAPLGSELDAAYLATWAKQPLAMSCAEPELAAFTGSDAPELALPVRFNPAPDDRDILGGRAAAVYIADIALHPRLDWLRGSCQVVPHRELDRQSDLLVPVVVCDRQLLWKLARAVDLWSDPRAADPGMAMLAFREIVENDEPASADELRSTCARWLAEPFRLELRAYTGVLSFLIAHEVSHLVARLEGTPAPPDTPSGECAEAATDELVLEDEKRADRAGAAALLRGVADTSPIADAGGVFAALTIVTYLADVELGVLLKGHGRARGRAAAFVEHVEPSLRVVLSAIGEPLLARTFADVSSQTRAMVCGCPAEVRRIHIERIESARAWLEQHGFVVIRGRESDIDEHRDFRGEPILGDAFGVGRSMDASEGVWVAGYACFEVPEPVDRAARRAVWSSGQPNPAAGLVLSPLVLPGTRPSEADLVLLDDVVAELERWQRSQ